MLEALPHRQKQAAQSSSTEMLVWPRKLSHLARVKTSLPEVTGKLA